MESFQVVEVDSFFQERPGPDETGAEAGVVKPEPVTVNDEPSPATIGAVNPPEYPDEIPRRPMVINPHGSTIGIQIEQRFVRIAIDNIEGRLLRGMLVPVPPAMKPVEVFEAIKMKLNELLNPHHQVLIGIGIGFPCLVNEDTGIVDKSSPVHHAFASLSIVNYLTRNFNVPIAIGRSLLLVARQETLRGMGEHFHSFAIILLGTVFDYARVQIDRDSDEVQITMRQHDIGQESLSFRTGDGTEVERKLNQYLGSAYFGDRVPVEEQKQGEWGFGLQQLIETMDKSDAAKKVYHQLCETLTGFMEQCCKEFEVHRFVIWAELGPRVARHMEGCLRELETSAKKAGCPFSYCVKVTDLDPFELVRGAAEAARYYVDSLYRRQQTDQ